MIVIYGGHTHPDNECAVQISKTPVLNKSRQRRSIIERWDITGFIQGTGADDSAKQANLFTRIQALEAAYAIIGGNLYLLKSDSSFTPHYIVAAGCIRPPQLVDGIHYREYRGAELVTFRTFTLAVEAEYFDVGVELEEWTETVTFMGGGPMDHHLETLIGIPIKQRTGLQTTYRATQEGSAVGLRGFPTPPNPIWPESLVVPLSQTQKVLPERSSNGQYSFYKVTWHYEFAHSSPLLGDPTPWPS